MKRMIKILVIPIFLFLSSCTGASKNDSEIIYPIFTMPQGELVLNAEALEINQYEVSSELRPHIKGWYEKLFQTHGNAGAITVEIDEFTIDVNEVSKGFFDREVEIIGITRVDCEITNESNASISIALSSNRTLKGSFTEQDVLRAKQSVLQELLKQTEIKIIETADIYFGEFQIDIKDTDEKEA